jgi:hypothetical protein
MTLYSVFVYSVFFYFLSFFLSLFLPNTYFLRIFPLYPHVFGGPYLFGELYLF